MNAAFAAQFDRMFEALADVHRATRAHRERREVGRLCLHCAEAVANYLSDAPPPNCGAHLPKGIRSRPGNPEVPGAEVADYLAATRRDAAAYLATLDLGRGKDAWPMSPLKRTLYVMRHTQHHLGQISLLVADAYDINKLCRP